MMNIRFLTMAETEIDEAVSWYQENLKMKVSHF